MKKKSILIAMTALLMAGILVVLAACGSKESTMDKMKKRVSFQQTDLMTASNELFEVTFSAGITEEDFVADGEVGTLKEFARLQVTPIDYNLVDSEFTYTLKSPNGEISGDLEKNYLGISFSACACAILEFGLPSEVIIRSEGLEEKLTLENRSNAFVTSTAALEAAVEELLPEIEAEMAGDGFKREIYIKLINDTTDFNSPYYWYVSFIENDKDYWAVLVDPFTKQILSKKA